MTEVIPAALAAISGILSQWIVKRMIGVSGRIRLSSGTAASPLMIGMA